MTTRIVINSPKGGSGRSTVALNLAVALAEKQYQVLLMDLDPRSGIGFHLGKGNDRWTGLADALMGRTTLHAAVKSSNLPTLKLLPRGRLDPVNEPEFESILYRIEMLDGILRHVDREFDFIIMDVPAGSGMITRRALSRAHAAITVLRPKPLEVRGLQRILRTIDYCQNRENPELRFLGVLACQADRNSETEKTLLQQIRDQGTPLLPTIIPHSSSFEVAAFRGQPIMRVRAQGVETKSFAPGSRPKSRIWLDEATSLSNQSTPWRTRPLATPDNGALSCHSSSHGFAPVRAHRPAATARMKRSLARLRQTPPLVPLNGAHSLIRA